MINCNNAKKISLVSILEKIGARKIKQNNREIWYISPFRNESTGSFKVDVTKNIWFDHGEGIGGNVLDFVMQYYKCDLKGALQILDSQSFSFHQPTFNNIASEKEKNYEIRMIKPLTNLQLIDYIKSRRIDLKMAKKYCCEVHYILNKKEYYYGVGFKNVLEGYDIRNLYVKMCLNKKAPSYFSNKSNKIVLLESFTDYLSFLTLYPKTEKSYDFLILNSVGTLNTILNNDANNYLYKCTNVQLYKSIKNTLYKELKYDIIICCFDNDNAGNKATEKVQRIFPNCVKDGRILYSNHKDLNDFLLAKFRR